MYGARRVCWGLIWVFFVSVGFGFWFFVRLSTRLLMEGSLEDTEDREKVAAAEARVQSTQISLLAVVVVLSIHPTTSVSFP